jgi:hypothetical protein
LAIALRVNEAHAVERLSVLAATPAAPAGKLPTEPALPPHANWVKLKAPDVLPVTALFRMADAPAPPLRPLPPVSVPVTVTAPLVAVPLTAAKAAQPPLPPTPEEL